MPPCAWCTHEDNPHNILEEDGAYQTVELPDEEENASLAMLWASEFSKSSGEDSSECEDGLEDLVQYIDMPEYAIEIIDLVMDLEEDDEYDELDPDQWMLYEG